LPPDELRAIANADDHGACGADTGDGDGISRRHENGKQSRALRDVAAADPNVVFDDDGHTGERQGFASVEARGDR
jgi:hypothetical protein